MRRGVTQTTKHKSFLKICNSIRTNISEHILNVSNSDMITFNEDHIKYLCETININKNINTVVLDNLSICTNIYNIQLFFINSPNN